jgi:hypothetical protein
MNTGAKTSGNDSTGGSLFGGSKDTGTVFNEILFGTSDLWSQLAWAGRESWGIGPATNVNNVAVKIGKMSGAQLQALIKHLPDGVTYGLDLEKEEGN